MVLGAFYACNRPNPNLTDTSPLHKDSVLVAEVDTIVEDIYEILRTGVNPIETSLELADSDGSMSYYDLPGGLARWDTKVAPAGMERYATFFLKDEKPVLFRYREWLMEENISATELVIYLKKGKIFYAKERTMPLYAGQSPAILRDQPHGDSHRSRKELWEIMQRYYPAMKKAWDEREQS